jgi:hypothetical protein
MDIVTRTTPQTAAPLPKLLLFREESASTLSISLRSVDYTYALCRASAFAPCPCSAFAHVATITASKRSCRAFTHFA